MSRVSYAEEEEFYGQFALWQANCDRSLAGKKGQSALRELESALLALPAKRLIANELDNGADCCAIGALVRHKGLDPEVIEGEFDTEYEMEEVGVECGMPRLVAWKVVALNDNETDYHYVNAPGPTRYPGSNYEGGYDLRVHYTPEERYSIVLKWIRKQLSEASP